MTTLYSGPFDIAGSIFDWMFAHIPLIAITIGLVLIANWLTYRATQLISGYMVRFKQVEVDVAVLKDNMVGSEQAPGWH